MNYFVIGLIFGLGFRLGCVIVNFAFEMLDRGIHSATNRIENTIGQIGQNSSGKNSSTKMKIGF